MSCITNLLETPESWTRLLDEGYGIAVIYLDYKKAFYPRDAMLARVIEIATCLSVCLSRAGIVSKRRKLAA